MSYLRQVSIQRPTAPIMKCGPCKGQGFIETEVQITCTNCRGRTINQPCIKCRRTRVIRVRCWIKHGLCNGTGRLY